MISWTYSCYKLVRMFLSLCFEFSISLSAFWLLCFASSPTSFVFSCLKSLYTWSKYGGSCLGECLYKVQYDCFWKCLSLLDFYGQQWVRLPLYHYHNHFYRRQIGQLTHCRFYREQLDPHLLRPVLPTKLLLIRSCRSGNLQIRYIYICSTLLKGGLCGSFVSHN